MYLSSALETQAGSPSFGAFVTNFYHLDLDILCTWESQLQK